MVKLMNSLVTCSFIYHEDLHLCIPVFGFDLSQWKVNFIHSNLLYLLMSLLATWCRWKLHLGILFVQLSNGKHFSSTSSINILT